MHNQLDATMLQLRRQKQKALIAYLAAGYPKFSEQIKLIQGMVKNGVDVLEVGIPFSDPIADGPTIQFASQEAFKNGVSVKKIFHWLKELRKKVDVPIVLMTYINPVLAFGIETFARAAEQSGVSGVIVPDMIPEESGELREKLNRHHIHLIHLVAPTTPFPRQLKIARQSGGFLYAVSVAGVTGARRSLPKETKNWLKKIRKASPLPVCVGFGISNPSVIRELKEGADGFIVGSAVIDLIRKTKTSQRRKSMGKFIRLLSKECDYAG
ncbi:MAG: Tryptophan synthase alpha chain [Elusimicrobia bacterium]|nr:Tryptophan synthase alpha chain [Elusimicrobiota bacterium]